MSIVLVVEDDLTQQHLLSKLLERVGLTVIAAGDGVEALEKVQQFHPNLVILDIVLPRMNGYEVCRRLKSEPETETIPVLMCSAKKEDFDRYWGMKQGADAYLAKPCHPQEIVETVKKLLKSHHQAAS